jgi:hypothetical protein
MATSAPCARQPSRSAFAVEFVDELGRLRDGLLSELWSVRFEHAGQVRSFPSFKGQKNFTGSYYAACLDDFVGFESWLERDVAMTLDFDPEVVAFSSQPFRLAWSAQARKRRHVPDFFARLADGTGVVVDVRPDDRIEPEDAEAFAATARACQEVGWVFRRTGGPGMLLAANIRWLAGYRHRRYRREDIAERAAGVFAQPTPLLAGARRIGDPLGVLPVLYHLMWRQDLTADLAGGLLGLGTRVSVRRGGPKR